MHRANTPSVCPMSLTQHWSILRNHTLDVKPTVQQEVDNTATKPASPVPLQKNSVGGATATCQAAWCVDWADNCCVGVWAADLRHLHGIPVKLTLARAYQWYHFAAARTIPCCWRIRVSELMAAGASVARSLTVRELLTHASGRQGLRNTSFFASASAQHGAVCVRAVSVSVRHGRSVGRSVSQHCSVEPRLSLREALQLYRPRHRAQTMVRVLFCLYSLYYILYSTQVAIVGLTAIDWNRRTLIALIGESVFQSFVCVKCLVSE